MFEQSKDNVEKDRSRLVVMISGIAVAAVIVLIVLVSSFCKSGGRFEMAGPESDEFKAYVNNIKVELVDKREGERDLGKLVRYARLVCHVTNMGDKPLVGLQLKGIAVGFNNETLREKVTTYIPGPHRELDPGEMIRVELTMEPIPDPSTIMDFKVEVAGLKIETE
ncbi:MAG TPA: hypothetical protein VF131_09560 [Blastocatellia bacterium]|nr:hypothetical protein [Blastocatellia bacterium]